MATYLDRTARKEAAATLVPYMKQGWQAWRFVTRSEGRHHIHLLLLLLRAHSFLTPLCLWLPLWLWRWR